MLSLSDDLIRFGLQAIARTQQVNDECGKQWFSKWNPTNNQHISYCKFCNNPRKCDMCAVRIGGEYRGRVEQVMHSPVFVVLWTIPERESFRRKYGTKHYMSYPLGEMALVFHDVPEAAGDLIDQEWLDDYDWTELARQKTGNVSGKLGKAEKKDDTTERYPAIALAASPDAKEQVAQIARKAGSLVYHEHGAAQSALDAKHMMDKYETLIALWLLSADLIEGIDYTLQHTWSRAEFQVKNSLEYSNSKIDKAFYAELVKAGELLPATT